MYTLLLFMLLLALYDRQSQETEQLLWLRLKLAVTSLYVHIFLTLQGTCLQEYILFSCGFSVHNFQFLSFFSYERQYLNHKKYCWLLFSSAFISVEQTKMRFWPWQALVTPYLVYFPTIHIALDNNFMCYINSGSHRSDGLLNFIFV